MRRFKDSAVLFTGIVCFAILTSCGGLSKMAEDAKFVQWNVTPKILEMRNGDVEVELTVTFPPKYFQAAAVVQITPVLKYDGKEKIFDRSIRVQGEAVQANNEICSFANGGTFRTKSKIRFEEKMRCSELYIRATVSMRGQPIDLPEQKVACGVIAPFTNYTTSEYYFAGTEWLLLNKYRNVALPPKAKLKKLDYPSGYSVECYLVNDEIADNQPFTITDKSSGKVIFEGCAIDNHKRFVGTWKKGAYESVCGTFAITNTNDGEFSLKAKKTTNPSFTVQKINSYITKCGNNPVLLDLSRLGCTLIVCNIGGYGNWFETSTINKTTAEQVYHSGIHEVFPDGIKGIVQVENGGCFEGLVAFNNNSSEFEAREGKRTYSKGKYRDVEISKETNSHRINVSFASGNEISKVSMVLNDIEFNKIKWWSIDDYIKNANEIELKYSNGDSFKGRATYTNGRIKPNNGVYTYVNGDKFTGNLVDKAAGDIFVDGTTTFGTDNISVNGNWLSEYQLTPTQLSEISEMNTLSSKRKYAERKKAEKTFYKYIENGDRAYQSNKYEDAAMWYEQALKSKPNDIDEDKNLKGKIDRVNQIVVKEKNKKRLIAKYGQAKGTKLANGILEIGMTKDMCEDIGIDESVYRVSKHRDINGKTIEEWEYDPDKVMSAVNNEFNSIDTDDVESALAVALVQAFTQAAGGSVKQYASSKFKYKYIKFKNNVIVELRDHSVYEDIDDSYNDIMNSLMWGF